MNIGIAEIRTRLADALNCVLYLGERIILERRGNEVAAIVSIDDLTLLQLLEDGDDVRAARRALAEMNRRGHRPESWESVKQELGL